MSSSHNDLPFQKQPKSKDEGLWLTSFCDLCMLLMSFFIFLLSMSTLDKKKLNSVNEPPKQEQTQQDPKVEAQKKLKRLSEEILSEIKNQKLPAVVNYDLDGLAIEIHDQLFFKSGSAKINNQFKPLTDRLLKIIAKAPKNYNMVFEGHTDDTPLAKNAEFNTNWELSASRAVSMLDELKKKGVPESRMSVIAFAHTKPKKDFKNKKGKELEKARAANRRVVIRIQ